MNIANLLTLSRISLIPVFIGFYYLQFENPWANTTLVVIFCLAALTDYLDGYLARKMKIDTKLGAFLDPVADKLMVVTALVLLIDFYHNIFITLPALIIIIREISVSALREWMNSLGQGGDIAVSRMGKIKTSSQLVAIAFLLDAHNLLGFSSYQMGLILLYISTILTLWSGASYLQKTLKTFDNTE